jgi:hypothetical protein
VGAELISDRLLVVPASTISHAVLASLPILPVQRAVLHRLGDVFGLNLFARAQVRNRSGHLQDAVVRAGRYQLLLGHEFTMARREKIGGPIGSIRLSELLECWGLRSPH